MPLQYQILNMLSEVSRTASRTEGKLDALAGRVDRMEDREHGRLSSAITGQRAQSQTWGPRDYIMAGAGVALVIAAALHKVPWQLVATFVSSLK